MPANFIIIVADDLGWGDVGYNGSDIYTPNIDNLALEGTRFNQFYVQPICSPTRASLLTGKYPYRYGLQRVLWPWNHHGLSLKEKLLPQLLPGYKSYQIGKWHLGHGKPEYWPINRGFTYQYGAFTGAVDPVLHTYYDVHDFQENGKPVYPTGHTTDLYTDKCLDILKVQSASAPFLIYLAYNAPHIPLKAKPYYYNSYSRIKDETRRTYASVVSHLDDSIGRIVDALKVRGLYDNTLLWFTSDNGGWVGKGSNNGVLRGGKISVYEGGIRAVNFVHFPRSNNGLEVNQPCHAVDVSATLLAMNQLAADGDGMSLTKFMMAKDAPAVERDIIHSLYADGGQVAGCIRSKNWKLHYYENKTELYDIDADPGETTALAYPKVIERLRDKLVAEKDHYVVDAPNWTKPSGYPEGYKFPKYWGETQEEMVQMLSVETTPLHEQKKHELLGYPHSFNV